MNPADLKYSKNHMWVRLRGTVAVVGVTDHAQGSLGEVLSVELPAAGTDVKAGLQLASLDCAKTASILYSPVSGRVLGANGELVDHPGLVNEDPYGAGWVAEVELAEPAEVESLLDVTTYEDYVDRLV